MLAIPKVTPKYENGMERKRISHMNRAGEKFQSLIYASKSIQTPASSYSCLYFLIEIERQKSVKRHFSATSAVTHKAIQTQYSCRFRRDEGVPPYESILLFFIYIGCQHGHQQGTS